MRMAFCRFKMGGPWFIPTSSLHKVSREMSTGIQLSSLYSSAGYFLGLLLPIIRRFIGGTSVGMFELLEAPKMIRVTSGDSIYC